jgi:ABC-type polysaccharide/polyol phosphate transport system ATPase subunit
MSPEGTIDVTRVWKRFRADRRRMLLRDELERLAGRLRGEPDKGWRWVLRDIDLHVGPGESVGLVGANGSGKSTLLKILSRVMYPYAGSVAVSGRLGALIEVRAGLHADLSGRENVYLYGSILGRSRRDVARRFDEIVAFAEVEGAVDRQLKFYSSGMQMRLGFAIAAFLEPDVLLVDEVLAVGDASFQQKCLDRMRGVLGQGTTLVFVSHDLAAVEATCTRGVWLDGGTVREEGTIRDVLAAYRRWAKEGAEIALRVGGLVNLLSADVGSGGGQGVTTTSGPLDVQLVVESEDPRPGQLFLGVSEGTATPIFLLRHDLHLSSGKTQVSCHIPRLPLPRRRYYLWVGMTGKGGDLLPWQPAAHLDVSGPDLDEAPVGVVRLAPIHVESRWEVEGL